MKILHLNIQLGCRVLKRGDAIKNVVNNQMIKIHVGALHNYSHPYIILFRFLLRKIVYQTSCFTTYK